MSSHCQWEIFKTRMYTSCHLDKIIFKIHWHTFSLVQRGCNTATDNGRILYCIEQILYFCCFPKTVKRSQRKSTNSVGRTPPRMTRYMIEKQKWTKWKNNFPNNSCWQNTLLCIIIYCLFALIFSKYQIITHLLSWYGGIVSGKYVTVLRNKSIKKKKLCYSSSAFRQR